VVTWSSPIRYASQRSQDMISNPRESIISRVVSGELHRSVSLLATFGDIHGVYVCAIEEFFNFAAPGFAGEECQNSRGIEYGSSHPQPGVLESIRLPAKRLWV